MRQHEKGWQFIVGLLIMVMASTIITTCTVHESNQTDRVRILMRANDSQQANVEADRPTFQASTLPSIHAKPE